MNQDKPKQTLANEKCPICAKGHFRLIKITHRENCPDAPQVAIPGVWVNRCDSCREVVYPPESTRYIERFMAETSETLSPHELEQIRENLGVDQTEMSEILGLGSKSYHRWEKGTQYPSRSMGYYIRVLAEFPDAFAWLRAREWKKINRLATHASSASIESFPALMRLESKEGAKVVALSSASPRINYAKLFSTSHRQ